MNYFKSFGMTIQSCISLPSYTTAEDKPDVVIRYGSVPDCLPDARRIRIYSQSSPGKFLFTMNKVAKYLVSDGSNITIERMPNAREEEIRLFLMGTAWGALLFQRGFLPIHGSAVFVNGRGVIFTGGSGIGKSTLATAFALRGYRLLSDDLCAISSEKGEKIIMTPGFPQIKLWAHSLNKLNMDKEKLLPVRPNMEKYSWQASDNFCSSPVPLHKIYILSIINGMDFKKSEITGTDKISLLAANTFRKGQADGLGVRVLHFRQCLAVSKYVCMTYIKRPVDEFRLEELIELVEEDFRR